MRVTYLSPKKIIGEGYGTALADNKGQRGSIWMIYHIAKHM
jgi:hypothetical protein